MNTLFANRILTTQKSFIREILKVTENPEVISFAGGLPNSRFIPVKEIKDAASKVLEEDGRNVLQYSTTEGYPPLREFISERYLKKKGLNIDPDEILITNGSQQCYDLIGKTFLNTGDHVAIERPGYLGTIQAFSMFEPAFHSVPLLDDGIDTVSLERTFEEHRIKMFSAVINFQNPSGITYSKQKRVELAGILSDHNSIFVEDDPYGELRFMGEDIPSVRNYLKENTILMGSFSKIVSPGMRLGWICARKEIMEKMVVAKQAADLHSNYLSQRILYRHLIDNDLDEHILKIRKAYKEQRDLMVSLIEEQFPEEIKCTKPEGGMFLWITLPENLSSMELFDRAIKENVAFVPGSPFYVGGGGENTLRLNFSNSDEEKIEKGIKRLAGIIKKVISEKHGG
ncbi:MAG: PLP-dependent aminotransferase family protein [Euryarchaeota archaeon]|nr:PLP-dependent aminotransferase family protein [Euryarchaeota archaeon]MBU4340191.1 PLP-dependent aminotransferase family protein [Euryarchaeota archaeon]MBU4454599.1 PLP-dependent aminotransferase family protein [Euryarchaeota archaeon]MCG2737313.1 PLP-dependent aminotransferase family protein [Candidatus Methanoperedenaceae archaeon]